MLSDNKRKEKRTPPKGSGGKGAHGWSSGGGSKLSPAQIISPTGHRKVSYFRLVRINGSPYLISGFLFAGLQLIFPSLLSPNIHMFRIHRWQESFYDGRVS